MSSTGERMLRVLDVVEAGPASMSFEQVHDALGYTRSTLYRYLKTLTDAGLLTSLGDVGYALGPRIAELDCAMRDRDALIGAARPVMAELARSVPGHRAAVPPLPRPGAVRAPGTGRGAVRQRLRAGPGAAAAAGGGVTHHPGPPAPGGSWPGCMLRCTRASSRPPGWARTCRRCAPLCATFVPGGGTARPARSRPGSPASRPRLFDSERRRAGQPQRVGVAPRHPAGRPRKPIAERVRFCANIVSQAVARPAHSPK